jgi:hypothetical protein
LARPNFCKILRFRVSPVLYQDLYDSSYIKDLKDKDIRLFASLESRDIYMTYHFRRYLGSLSEFLDQDCTIKVITEDEIPLIFFLEKGKICFSITDPFELVSKRGQVELSSNHFFGDYIFFKVLDSIPSSHRWFYLPTVLEILNIAGLEQYFFEAGQSPELSPYKFIRSEYIPIPEKRLKNIVCLQSGYRLTNPGIVKDKDDEIPTGQKSTFDLLKYQNPNPAIKLAANIRARQSIDMPKANDLADRIVNFILKKSIPLLQEKPKDVKFVDVDLKVKKIVTDPVFLKTLREKKIIEDAESFITCEHARFNYEGLFREINQRKKYNYLTYLLQRENIYNAIKELLEEEFVASLPEMTEEDMILMQFEVEN